MKKKKMTLMTMTTIVALDTMIVLVSISALLKEKNELLNKINLLLIVVVTIVVVVAAAVGGSGVGAVVVSYVTFRHWLILIVLLVAY